MCLEKTHRLRTREIILSSSDHRPYRLCWLSFWPTIWWMIWCIYIYIYIHTWTYIYIYIYTYTYIYLYVYIHTHTYIYIYMYIYTHFNVYTCVYIQLFWHSICHLLWHSYPISPYISGHLPCIFSVPGSFPPPGPSLPFACDLQHIRATTLHLQPLCSIQGPYASCKILRC